MKLRGEKRRPRALAAREMLEVQASQEPLAFDPERDITPEQRGRMLSYGSPHDQHLLAMGLTAFLFPGNSRVKQETDGFHFRMEVMKGTKLSQQTGRQILETLKSHMVGETGASLYPLSLLHELPTEFAHTLAEKIWTEEFRKQKIFSKEKPISTDVFYGLMIIIGAENLLPERKEELENYRTWVKSGISIQKILQELQFGQDYQYRNWNLLELALAAVAFPELHSEIRLDDDFWVNIRQEIQMYTDNYESLFAAEAAFAATVLAKIPKQKFKGSSPLPERLVA